jgi:GH25 family lysozyme M1 (1,4-beta-N-acetylmuramidase)
MNPIVIDIYHGNVVKDFGLLRDAGIVGVIHKAVQGARIDDHLYAVRRLAAKTAGLMWGAYCFNTGEPVSAQVDEFFRVADPDDQTLMCLDFEDNPHSQMSLQQAIDFLGLVDQKLGRKCWIYSGNRIKDLLGSKVNTFLGSHPLWLAQYGPRAVVQNSWSRYNLWQYSEHGQLPGTDGYLDLNVADPDQIKLDWIAP